MKLIPRSKWTPIDVQDLEPIAERVVRSRTNTSVVAGPGAGKTELLAQRAAFLLQTGECPNPRRILAISFKRDAARNLKERINARCENEHARRFDSFTFDRFAKNLLDRFYNALPQPWRPAKDYSILFSNSQIINDFLDQLPSPPRHLAASGGVERIYRITFEKKFVLGKPIEDEGFSEESLEWWAANKWWMSCLDDGHGNSILTFPMIGRLVGFLIQCNPQIKAALMLTYSHVFMDEFQDTTHIQYDLVKTIFEGSLSVLTAVGDYKQQIMRWAMALDDAFGLFEGDFEAERLELIRNYRSTPGLVAIQHHIALIVDPNSSPAESMREIQHSKKACVIWEFATPDEEAETIAKEIFEVMQRESLSPRDFAILVRQKARDYEPALKKALGKRGILARNEEKLQDLLSEHLTSLLLAFLHFGSQKRSSAYWSECCGLISGLHGIDPNSDACGREAQAELGGFHRELREKMSTISEDEEKLHEILTMILGYLGVDLIKNLYGEYKQGDWYDTVLSDIQKSLLASAQESSNWQEALDDFEGINAVPIMTIHKSKGLEFHTMFFVGLDDKAWWAYLKQEHENRSAFFVAFSRAKARVVFSYCPQRGRRKNISKLYEVLTDAGVQTVDFLNSRPLKSA